MRRPCHGREPKRYVRCTATAVAASWPMPERCHYRIKKPPALSAEPRVKVPLRKGLRRKGGNGALLQQLVYQLSWRLSY